MRCRAASARRARLWRCTAAAQTEPHRAVRGMRENPGPRCDLLLRGYHAQAASLLDHKHARSPVPEPETPQKPPADRRAEVEAMLKAVQREVVVIHSSKDKCEQLWDALRPDLWPEQAGSFWQEHNALYNTAQMIRVRRILDQPGGKFTLAKLYELIAKNADLYTRTEYAARWDMSDTSREAAHRLANETYDEFASEEDPDDLDLPKLRRMLAPRPTKKRLEVPPEEKAAYEASGAPRFDAFANLRVAHNVDLSETDYTRDEFELYIAVLEERLKHATLLVTRAGLVSATPGGLDDFAAPLWALSPAQTSHERRFYWTENEVLFAETRLHQASEEDRPAAEAALESARAEHQAARDALFGGTDR